MLLGVHHDHAFAIILTPAGPERTIERIELYYASDDVASQAYDDMRQVNTAMWKKVFEEDIQVVEGMQSGRHAPYMMVVNSLASWIRQRIIFTNG